MNEIQTTPPTPSQADYLGTRRAPAPPAVKFEREGDAVVGTVVAVQFEPDLIFKTAEQKRDKEGVPMYVLRVDLETTDGLRALWAGGSSRGGSESVRDALGAAVRAAGATEVEPGGRIRVEYLGTAPNSVGTGIRKRYACRYRTPDRAADRATPTSTDRTEGE